jgi:hypothetical protein
MSQTNGDHEMADAVPGADIDGDAKPERQRLRLVRHDKIVTRLSASLTFGDIVARLDRNCCILCVRERRSHVGKCATVYDYEEVCIHSFNACLRMVCR